MPATELQSLLTLSEGQKLYVTGEKVGSCAAEVLHVATPDELPPIAGAPDVGQVRAILEEFGVRQMALIAWHPRSLPKDKCLSCTVFGNGKGDWRDVQGQKLTIRGEVPHAS
jgi:hypothetical protein